MTLSDLSRYLRRSPTGGFAIQVPVPNALQTEFGGRKQIEVGLTTRDEALAVLRGKITLERYAVWFAAIAAAAPDMRAVMIRTRRPEGFKTLADVQGALVTAATGMVQDPRPDADMTDPANRLAAFDRADRIASAQRDLATMQAMVARIDAPPALHVSVMCARWLAATASMRDAKVAPRHTARVAAFIARHGDMAIDAPGFRDAVDTYCQGLFAGSHGVASVAAIAGTFKSITGWAMERNAIARDPMLGVKRAFKDNRPAKAKRAPYLPHHTAAIVAAMPAAYAGNPDRLALVSLIIASGCRAAEAAQARVSDVRDMGGDVFALTIGGAHRHEPQPDAGCPRSVKHPVSRRTIPLHPDMAPMIRDALARRQADVAKLGALHVRLFGDAGTPADMKDSDPTITALGAKQARVRDAACAGFTGAEGTPDAALIGGKNGESPLHSWRWTLATAFNTAKVHPQIAETYLGHTTRAYTSDATFADMTAAIKTVPVFGVAGEVQALAA